jgi:O-antigen ligase
VIGAITLNPQRRAIAWLAAAVATFFLAVVNVQASAFVVAAVPIAVLVGVQVLRYPWTGALLLLASVPVQQFGAAGPLTLTRACIPVAVAGFVIALTRAGLRIAWSRLYLPGLGLLLWMLWTAGSAVNADAAAAEILRWLVALAAMVIFLQLVAMGGRDAVRAIVLTMAIAGAAEAAIGTTRGLLGIGPESFAVGSAFARAYGTFGRPNTFAGYLEMALFPVMWVGWYAAGDLRQRLGEYRRDRSRGHRASQPARSALVQAAMFAVVLGGSTVIMLVGIISSYSRGAWLGVVAGGLVSGLVAFRRHWMYFGALVPIVALIVLGGAASVVPGALSDRLASISADARPFDAAAITITDDSFAAVERMAHWQAGWRMFEDNPLDGVGIGNFNERYPDYFVRTAFRVSQGHAHNFYIQVLGETGIPGLLLYLTMLLGFLFLAMRVALSADDRLAQAVSLGALGTTAAVAVHNVFENLHVLNLGIQLSACWALVLAADRRRCSSTASDVPGVEYSDS